MDSALSFKRLDPITPNRSSAHISGGPAGSRTREYSLAPLICTSFLPNVAYLPIQLDAQ